MLLIFILWLRPLRRVYFLWDKQDKICHPRCIPPTSYPKKTFYVRRSFADFIYSLKTSSWSHTYLLQDTKDKICLPRRVCNSVTEESLMFQDYLKILRKYSSPVFNSTLTKRKFKQICLLTTVSIIHTL